MNICKRPNLSRSGRTLTAARVPSSNAMMRQTETAMPETCGMQHHVGGSASGSTGFR